MTGQVHQNEKYVLLVGDGMADYPLPQLGQKTPLEVAHTPHMDRIAACRVGLARTVPRGMPPGSDVANLSLLGYDPLAYHTGRAPFEAASMGVDLTPEEVAFRMNLITLDRRSDQEMVMISHSSGDLSTEDALPLVETLQQALATPFIRIHAGVAYRHLLVWKDGPEASRTIPPHDVLDQNMAPYLNGDPPDPVVDLIRRSWPFLTDHPVNQKREQLGLKAANSIWLWGQGRALQIPSFQDRFGLTGGGISAVDLLRGIGVYAGLTPIRVEGATGYLDTNYAGKAEEALKALDGLDFVFVHVEAPDEASHNGNIEAKIEAIEAVDEKVLGRLLKGLEHFDHYRILVASDHFTPIVKKTHTDDPTPFAWATKGELALAPEPSSRREGGGTRFTEEFASASGLYLDKGHELMPIFLGRA
ncbi:MAG: cofactor-independent phosphoglycerate mutase [Deltaproteobacteria bacterium]|nr:cofactor-independent phosphoglycerate mutase [Deltaproteobacteria bacterium]